MLLKTTTLGGILALSAAAAPCGTATTKGTLTADNLIAIDKQTAKCDGSTQWPSECADAAHAAPAINKSFEKYGVKTPGEQAALVALMLYESGSFKYNIHHFGPVNPGQGTRNMQGPNFNKEYATTLLGADAVNQASTPDGILALVNKDDEKSFGSAAWFLTTKCSPEQRKGLADATAAGWTTYLTQCVGTGTDAADKAKRDVVWNAAIKVLAPGQEQ